MTPLEPLKEKKQAPVRRQKTWRNLARTNPKRQPLGDGSKTAKHHHLNPGSDEAKNRPSQRAEVTPLEPLKEKKQAPVRRQKTWRNLARTNPRQQPLGDGSKTAKHHLNPGSDEAKNRPSQDGEVTPLEPLNGKKQAPVRRQKTWRNLARTNPKRQPLGDACKTPLETLKEKKQAPVRRQKTWRNLARTNPRQQPLGNGSYTAKHHCFSAITHPTFETPQRNKQNINHQQTYASSSHPFSPPPRQRRGVGGYICLLHDHDSIYFLNAHTHTYIYIFREPGWCLANHFTKVPFLGGGAAQCYFPGAGRMVQL